ncbi:MAG: hypothetical protein IJK24_00735 [Oscillospiraceae bacterium]|nr:hypothetical protein [Oscillospiraceae bacterium]
MARERKTTSKIKIYAPELLHSEAEVIKWYMPVIDALLRLDGEASKKDAINKVIELNKVTSEELSRTIKSGESALIRRIEFARNDLRVEGFIDGTVRGIWKLTELGKRIIITEDLAGKIRAKSIRISGILRKNKKLIEPLPIPQIDLSAYYLFRNSKQSYNQVIDEQAVKAERDADEGLLNDLAESAVLVASKPLQYNTLPKRRSDPIELHGRMTYPRSKTTAINALSWANYCCEIDSAHSTFLRRNSTCQYTEPHHLVLMAYQSQFEVSLDVEENIVSLCCSCHKQIHYGADSERLLQQLFLEREERLISVGIIITMKQLLSMYALCDNLDQ